MGCAKLGQMCRCHLLKDIAYCKQWCLAGDARSPDWLIAPRVSAFIFLHGCQRAHLVKASRKAIWQCHMGRMKQACESHVQQYHQQQHVHHIIFSMPRPDPVQTRWLMGHPNSCQGLHPNTCIQPPPIPPPPPHASKALPMHLLKHSLPSEGQCNGWACK